MTIDERIEKPTERHEALAQSVGLLTIDIAKLGEKVDQTSKTVDVLARSVIELVGVVRKHEHRIAALEG